MGTTTKKTKGGTDDGWLDLQPGDRVQVKSKSGNDYQATVVYAGVDDAGIYVKLANGTLARLVPSRVNWKTLQKLGQGQTVATGDEVIIIALGGVGDRGRVREIDDRVVFSKPTGTSITLSVSEAKQKKFRLIFRTKSLRAGDEFMVKSKSGREIVGRVLGIDERKITASLRPSKERVTIRIDHLDMESLCVLIPVLGASPTLSS